MNNRTIKFRGKRIDTGEWVTGFYFIDLENKLPYIMLDKRKETAEDWMIKSIQVHPESVGQFTGLTDNNGKEIYELNEINKKYRIVYKFNKYILQSISNIDIFAEINENDKYEITGEYSQI